MDIAVVPIFGTHGVGVVGSSEIAPSANKFGVVSGEDALSDGVEVVHGGVLHGIRSPSGEVALGVCPSDGFWHGDFVGGLHEVAGFRNGDEFVFVLTEPSGNEAFHKIENTGILPLMFAESFKIHEKIDEWTTETIVVEPTQVFRYSERSLAPATITKTEGDIVREPVILEEEF